MNLNTMSKAELIKLAESMQGAQANGLMVKINSSGGVYIRSSKFVAWSDKKSKSYTYGINLPRSVAETLFNDPELITMIKDQINALPK